MEEKLTFIIDFWRNWGKLAKLEYYTFENPENWEVTWSIWKESSRMKKYDGKLFGININRTKKRVKKEEGKSNHDCFDKLIKIEEERNLEWQIWLHQIDIDENLQCLTCSHIYWFSWLIDWMLSNSSCPNWRWVLDQFKIRPYKEIKNQITLMTK